MIFKGIDEEEKLIVGMISELIEVKDDRMNYQGFTKNDVCILI